jgi:hypothetical protein
MWGGTATNRSCFCDGKHHCLTALLVSGLVDSVGVNEVPFTNPNHVAVAKLLVHVVTEHGKVLYSYLFCQFALKVVPHVPLLCENEAQLAFHKKYQPTTWEQSTLVFYLFKTLFKRNDEFCEKRRRKARQGEKEKEGKEKEKKKKKKKNQPKVPKKRARGKQQTKEKPKKKKESKIIIINFCGAEFQLCNSVFHFCNSA